MTSHIVAPTDQISTRWASYGFPLQMYTVSAARSKGAHNPCSDLQPHFRCHPVRWDGDYGKQHHTWLSDDGLGEVSLWVGVSLQHTDTRGWKPTKLENPRS